MNPLSQSEIRKAVRKERMGMDPHLGRVLSQGACDRYWGALASVASARMVKGFHVALYRPLPDEVDLTALTELFSDMGASVSFPAISKVQSEMEMLAFQQTQDLKAGRWVSGELGIEEPDPALAQLIDPNTLDLIVVPGLAFGAGGERIGAGQGFYDRYLPRASRALRVALAFDFQFFDSLPQESWDQRVDWVVTPTREFRLPGLEKWRKKRGL